VRQVLIITLSVLLLARPASLSGQEAPSGFSGVPWGSQLDGIREKWGEPDTTREAGSATVVEFLNRRVGPVPGAVVSFTVSPEHGLQRGMFSLIENNPKRSERVYDAWEEIVRGRYGEPSLPCDHAPVELFCLDSERVHRWSFPDSVVEVTLYRSPSPAGPGVFLVYTGPRWHDVLAEPESGS